MYLSAACSGPHAKYATMTTTNEPASSLLCAKYQLNKSTPMFYCPQCMWMPLKTARISVGNVQPTDKSSFHIDVALTAPCVVGYIENGVLMTNLSVFMIIPCRETITNLAQILEPNKLAYPQLVIPAINSRISI